MVLYFTAEEDRPGATNWVIYMGRDKFENEHLIKYGWPCDVWFHVDKMSSAHVYLRMPRGATLDAIPENVLEDCCQLVKANSIQGSKENNVDIVYTPWGNLKKTTSMEVGQVGFHNQKQVRKVRVEKKKNEIINRLNKTKRELEPDLAQEREQYDREVAALKKKEVQAQKAMDKKAAEESRQEAERRSYTTLLDEDSMVSNKDLAGKYACAEDYEDDFM